MKKLLLSFAAVTAMGTFAVAGGDIAPVIEEVIIEEAPAGGFYLGGAYGNINADITNSLAAVDDSASISSFMLQVGYEISPYFAVEGRAWFGGSDDITNSTGTTTYSVDADAWGIFLKPTYPVTDAFDLYALLGYGDANVQVSPALYSGDTEGFQWGLGLSYDVMENLAVFADYVNLYNDTVGTTDITADAWNLGVTYKF